MALQISTSVEVYGTQLMFVNSYHQIDLINGNKEGLSMTVSVYDNHLKGNLIEQRSYSFVPSVAIDALNFIAQGYLYLKMQPEYEGAVDIIEEGISA